MNIYRNKNLSEYDPSEYRTVPTKIIQHCFIRARLYKGIRIILR